MALKVVGSNPTIHPLGSVIFFKKNKIKKKIFKKNTILIKEVKFEKINKLKLFLLMYFYKKYYYGNLNFTQNNKGEYKQLQLQNTTLLCISQKIYNNKGNIVIKKNLHTFSVGSIIKYFKVKQGKYVRRSLKGVKIFLNFLKNFLKKKFLKNNNNFILHLNGFDYNSCFLKKTFKNFFLINNKSSYLLVNLKISFTKTKDKKIKSIKKRLKKKIILNFIKSNKIKK